MSENKTVLMGDDGTNTGLFMFIANKEKDLSGDNLYVAKWMRTSATAGGTATLGWIKLGSVTSAEVKALVDTLKASDIVTIAGYAASGPLGRVQLNTKGLPASRLRHQRAMIGFWKSIINL
jgi:hypothetical protein